MTLEKFALLSRRTRLSVAVVILALIGAAAWTAGHFLQLLAEFRQKLAPFYSEIGRPSIDPELMIRMLIVGYCYGIRFERRLCEEVELHLAWFCRARGIAIDIALRFGTRSTINCLTGSSLVHAA
jgi:hypothetical protein